MRWLVFVLLCLPAASAQVQHSLDLEAAAVPEAIQPDVEAVPWRLQWTFDCQAGGTEAISTDATTLVLNVTAPAGINVRGPQATVVPAPTCGVEASNGSIDMTIEASQDAPGLEPLPVHVQAIVETNSPVPATLIATAEATFEVAYVGLVSADVPTTIQQGEPGSTSTYTVHITNYGNAPSRMVLATEHPDFELPDPPMLDAGESANVTVTYRHSDEAGLDNRETTAQVTITPVAEATGEEGQSVTVNLLSRTRSDLAVPAWPLPLLMMGLVLLARRRSA